MVNEFIHLFADHRRGNEFSILSRYDTSEIEPLENKQIEYFFASDASAVIEHTNQVIFLEVSCIVMEKIMIKQREYSKEIKRHSGVY